MLIKLKHEEEKKKEKQVKSDSDSEMEGEEPLGTEYNQKRRGFYREDQTYIYASTFY